MAERRSLTDSEKALVEKTISLVKFILYGQTQQVSSEAQLPESFSCLDKIKSPNIDLILRAEVIIRSKFKDNSQKDNKDDLFRAKSFIESIDKSKNHEIYL